MSARRRHSPWFGQRRRGPRSLRQAPWPSLAEMHALAWGLGPEGLLLPKTEAAEVLTELRSAMADLCSLGGAKARRPLEAGLAALLAQFAGSAQSVEFVLEDGRSVEVPGKVVASFAQGLMMRRLVEFTTELAERSAATGKLFRGPPANEP